MARPSDFTEDVAIEICASIAEGQSLASICRREGMPTMRTVLRWLESREAFRLNYTRAREAQADADADQINDLAMRVLAGEFEPNAARIAIDALKWAASKRAPKKYGDKVETVHSGSLEVQQITRKIVDPKADN